MVDPPVRQGGQVDSLGPLIVLGSGQRCGTTLVQRLLNSHPDVLIWGEHGGVLAPVLRGTAYLEYWDAEFGERNRQELTQFGYDGWTANLIADRDAIDRAARSYVRALFAEPAQARGRSRWGFKEVRYGAETIARLQALFPGTRVIHVTRDPRDVLRSLDAWERHDHYSRESTLETLSSWRAVNQEILELHDTPWVLSVRYEDIIADPRAFTTQLARFVGLADDALDMAVFAHKVHRYGSKGRTPWNLRPYAELDRGLRGLLSESDFVSVAAAYGYAIEADAQTSPSHWRWRARRS
jgi:hypothetical protein